VTHFDIPANASNDPKQPQGQQPMQKQMAPQSQSHPGMSHQQQPQQQQQKPGPNNGKPLHSLLILQDVN
jgi:hypothetical protein